MERHTLSASGDYHQPQLWDGRRKPDATIANLYLYTDLYSFTRSEFDADVHPVRDHHAHTVPGDAVAHAHRANAAADVDAIAATDYADTRYTYSHPTNADHTHTDWPVGYSVALPTTDYADANIHYADTGHSTLHTNTDHAHTDWPIGDAIALPAADHTDTNRMAAHTVPNKHGDTNHAAYSNTNTHVLTHLQGRLAGRVVPPRGGR
jgi:hypothetical protein